MGSKYLSMKPAHHPVAKMANTSFAGSAYAHIWQSNTQVELKVLIYRYNSQYGNVDLDVF